MDRFSRHQESAVIPQTTSHDEQQPKGPFSFSSFSCYFPFSFFSFFHFSFLFFSLLFLFLLFFSLLFDKFSIQLNPQSQHSITPYTKTNSRHNGQQGHLDGRKIQSGSIYNSNHHGHHNTSINNRQHNRLYTPCPHRETGVTRFDE